MQQLNPAFILHRRKYRNTSLLCDVFTPKEGRFSIIARGANESKRGLSALLQPFVPLLLSWTGRGEIKTLSKVEATANPFELKGNRLYCGFYLNELLVKMTHQHEAFNQLFAYYHHSLERLASSKETMENVLRHFELNLLDQLGHGLNLTHDTETGQGIKVDQDYFYDIERGLVAINANRVEKISGMTLLNLQNGTVLSAIEQREMRQMMRRVISFYLGNKTLKSRELFQ